MIQLRARIEQLRLAVIFLTRLPAGRLAEPIPELSSATWAFPIVGLLVGGITALVWLGMGALGMAPLLAAVLALGAQAMTTGALHQDGLADMADGLGGGRDRDHALQIMRDSRIGSYGALALMLCSLAWIVALSSLPQGALALIALAVASRVAMVVLLTEMPSARDKGLGQSASRQVRSYLPGALLALALLIPLGLPALAALAAMILTAGYVAHRAQKRIGGQTGDVLGATQLLCETAGLIALSLF